MKINREDFLRALESVEPGRTDKDTVAQSSCFVFLGGEVCTYNDELCCRAPSPLGELGAEGAAVPAGPLLEVLRRLTEEELDVSLDGAALTVKGRGRRTKVRREREVSLPLAGVERPVEDSWRALHPDFGEAVGMVQHCTGKDSTRFFTVCVHLHPDWVEATDGLQFARWSLPTGVGGPTLVRQKSVRHVTHLGVTEAAETPRWLHFRNPSGLILSCRRHLDVGEFPSEAATSFLGEASEGSLTLPASLQGALECAELFSKDGPGDNLVEVKLERSRKGDMELRLRGEGLHGEHEERKSVLYEGPPLGFLIAPRWLEMLVKKHPEVEIQRRRVVVRSGSYVYMASLRQLGDGGNGKGPG